MSDEQDRDDDPDREAILARRRRFIAVALAGLTGAAGCGDDAAVQPDPQQQTGAQTGEASGATLEPDPPKVDPADEQNTATGGEEASTGSTAGEEASTGTAAEGEPVEGAAGQAEPQPCLSVARPQPCLRRAAPRMQEPAPQPCLDVAAPRDEPPSPPPQVCLTPPRKTDGEDV